MRMICKLCKTPFDMDSGGHNYHCHKCLVEIGQRVVAEMGTARGEGSFWRGWSAAILYAVSGRE